MMKMWRNVETCGKMWRGAGGENAEKHGNTRKNRAALVRNNGFTYIIIPFLSISRMEHASDRQFVRYIVGYCSRR